MRAVGRVAAEKLSLHLIECSILGRIGGMHTGQQAFTEIQGGWQGAAGGGDAHQTA